MSCIGGSSSSASNKGKGKEIVATESSHGYESDSDLDFDLNLDSDSKLESKVESEEQQHEKKKPTWLDTLLRTKFWDPCKEHGSKNRTDQCMFCLKCSKVTCPRCTHRRPGHRLLKILLKPSPSSTFLGMFGF